MKLYHGTTEAIARAAFEDGLLSRDESGVESNWEKCPSRGDMVYLTRAYAPYFAMCAAGMEEKWGLVEIDTELMIEGTWDDQILEAFLHPDEDFLEQATRGGNSGCPDRLNMGERTAWFRENLLGFQAYWEDSIEGLGNCACLGPIPADSITKVVIFEPESNIGMAFMASDPMISIINYQLMGGSKYRALTDWFFDYDVEPSSFESSFALLEHPDVPQQLLDLIGKQYESLKKAISQKEGIEVLSWNTTQ